MSLVKVDSENKIKKSWLKKKKLKRLRTILRKCRNNYVTINMAMKDLKSVGLQVEADNLIEVRDLWVYKSAQLDNIIQRWND